MTVTRDGSSFLHKMSAMPSAENALRDSMQALVDLGTGAWFAGREAHEHGPKALYDVLLAVTTHREIALQHGVLLETPLKTTPQRECARTHAAARTLRHARCGVFSVSDSQSRAPLDMQTAKSSSTTASGAGSGGRATAGGGSPSATPRTRSWFRAWAAR
jgi:hypothetical protein